MLSARSLSSRQTTAKRKITNHTASDVQIQPILVVEPPQINGPFPLDKDPLTVQYEIVARLLLPAKDADVTASVVARDIPQGGECVEVQWTTSDEREPRGIWERSVVIALPRQFSIATCQVTGAPPQREQEVGS
jgi:hypothetical protein